MSKELLEKAQSAINVEILDKDINEYIKERWPKCKEWERRFILEILKGHTQTDAFAIAKQVVLGEKITSRNACKIGGYRASKRLDIPLEEILEYAGHGADDISEVLGNLKQDFPDLYLKHVEKLRQLDIKKIEHSGKIEMPVINIVTERKN